MQPPIWKIGVLNMSNFKQSGLADPKGPISASLQSRAIVMANQEVERCYAKRAKLTRNVDTSLLFHRYSVLVMIVMWFALA